jgi:hypothetical protein
VSTFKFVCITRCGKTNICIQNADTLYEAKNKFHKYNVLSHSPMRLLYIEYQINGVWFRV